MDNKELKMIPSKEEIIHLLLTNDKALGRALVMLNKRQTEDEQRSEETRHSNQRGFNAAHAKRGTCMARFYLTAGFLTPKQQDWWRQPVRVGSNIPRIGIYAEQLRDIAAAKQARKAQANKV